MDAKRGWNVHITRIEIGGAMEDASRREDTIEISTITTMK